MQEESFPQLSMESTVQQKFKVELNCLIYSVLCKLRAANGEHAVSVNV